jgi:2'-5' RNA ligase
MRKVHELLAPYKTLGEESFDYYSTQINLPGIGSEAVAASLIEEPDLYIEEADQGLETKPHITILYGIETLDLKAIRQAVGKLNLKEISFELGATEVFTPKDQPYDVVVLEVLSPDLHKLHDMIAHTVPTTEDFEVYKPHLTLAYVKRGQGAKYDQQNTPLTGQAYTVTGFVFCDKNSERQYPIRL